MQTLFGLEMFLSLFEDKRAAVAVGCSMPFCQILELEDGEIILMNYNDGIVLSGSISLLLSSSL